jgi:predicted acylesterase/phospholipase RssA
MFRQVLRFLWSICGVLLSWLLARFKLRDSRRAELIANRDAAMTHTEWRRWAREVDDYDGYQAWRTDETTALFNFDEVTARIRTLTEMRQRRDFAGLTTELTADFHRKMCGVTNPLLYSRYPTGTKTAAKTLIALLQRLISDLGAPTPGLSREQKLAAVSDLAHAYGHTALILNASAAFGLYHLGVVKVLYENQVLPRVIFGRSSGAIAAALLCCCNNVEEALDVDRIDTSAFAQRERVAGPGFWRRINRFLSEGTLMDVSVLMRFARDNLGDVTFEEAYQRTGRVLNIFVAKPVPELNREAGWLLNYLTAPNITIASAAVASCATTAIYALVPLMQKTRRGTIVECLPGSLTWTAESSVFHVNRAMSRIRHLFNVNFFIVADASFMHLPFLTFRGSTSLLGKLCHFVTEEVWRACGGLARLLQSRYAALFDALNEAPEGDVVLCPVTDISEAFECLTNPSRKLLSACRAKGERVVWPRLEEIRANMLIECALHDALVELHGSRALHEIQHDAALDHFTF